RGRGHRRGVLSPHCLAPYDWLPRSGLINPRYSGSGPRVRSIFVEETWAISGVDLHLDLPGNRVRAGLEAALREAVQAGRLVPGTRLPSSRSLAVDLGIARNTVAEAYAQLVAEGWLSARQGSGTRVADAAALSPKPA